MIYAGFKSFKNRGTNRLICKIACMIINKKHKNTYSFSQLKKKQKYPSSFTSEDLSCWILTLYNSGFPFILHISFTLSFIKPSPKN